MGNDVHERIRRRARLLELVKEIGNISEACRQIGVSRATFYYYQRLKAANGEEALFQNRHRKPNLKNRVPEDVERSVVAYAFENPSHGQQRACEELCRRGICVSPTGIRSIWKRHELENCRKRYRAVRKRQREGMISRSALARTDSERI
jgi:molybdenum-dependent DNA-binding transcriptional regulator ModE